MLITKLRISVSQKDAAYPTQMLHITFNMGFAGTEQVIRQLITNLASARFQCEIACIDGDVGAIGCPTDR